MGNKIVSAVPYMIMSESKEKIVQAAEQLFLKYGMKGVTMDDISRKLAISKKTIYNYYKDKDDIVNIVTERYLEREISRINEIRKNAQNAIHELTLESDHIREHMQNINPAIITELQKYHRPAWKIYLGFRDKVLFQMVEQTLARGVREGLFRADIDVKVLAVLRVEECQMMLNTNSFSRDTFNFHDVENQLMVHYMKGILTPEGFKIYEQYIHS